MIVFAVWLNVVVELAEFLTKSAYLVNIPQTLQLPILRYLMFDRHVPMVVAFFIFLVTLSMDVLGDFIEIVLPSLWNINISIFLLSFSLLGDSRDTD